MHLPDAQGSLYQDADFADLFPKRGRAAEALVNHFVADEEEVNEEDNDEEDDTLIDEEVTPGQVR